MGSANLPLPLFLRSQNRPFIEDALTSQSRYNGVSNEGCLSRFLIREHEDEEITQTDGCFLLVVPHDGTSRLCLP